MKIVALVLAVFFSTLNCSSNKNAVNKAQDLIFVYEVSSRGFYQQTKVSKEALEFSEDKATTQGEVYTVSDSDWDELMNLLKGIDVKDLQNLDSPTNYRAVDGAAIATFSVTLKGETFKTSMFDKGYPPIEIKPLVEKMVSMRAIVAKN